MSFDTRRLLARSSVGVKIEDLPGLIAKAQAGDKEAQDKVVTYNMRLVAKIAGKICRGRFKEYYDDALSEGCFGIIRALKTYDSEKGAFSTYATHWVVQAIRRSISTKFDLIRLPCYLREKVTKYNHAIEQTGDTCDREELMRLSGLSDEDIDTLSRYGVRATLSLDTMLTTEDSDDRSLHHLLPAPTENPGVQMDIEYYLSRLIPIDRDIVKARLGLDEHTVPMTLLELGKKYGISRERVRQLELRAFAVMRGEREYSPAIRAKYFGEEPMPRGKNFSEEQILELVTMYVNEGLGVHDIERLSKARIGRYVRASNVGRLLKKAGVEVRRGPRHRKARGLLQADAASLINDIQGKTKSCDMKAVRVLQELKTRLDNIGEVLDVLISTLKDC